MSQAKSSFLSDLTAIQNNLDQQVEQIIELSQVQKKSPQVSKSVSITAPVHKEKPQETEKDLPRRITTRKELPKMPEAQLVNVTTRLQSTTNDKLTEVTYRQKIKKQFPDNRQAIIEAALQLWFKKAGYGENLPTEAD